MAALKHHRREFFDPTMAKHGGRIFKMMGDGFLVEFGSAVSATQCAVDIQLGMAPRNQGLPEDQHIIFRIGVNLGDVISISDTGRSVLCPANWVSWISPDLPLMASPGISYSRKSPCVRPDTAPTSMAKSAKLSPSTSPVTRPFA